MNIESKLSGHWTDEQLIENLYGLGPDDRHLEGCAVCQERLSVMQANRRALEVESSQDVSFDFLAAQRRQIYAKLTQPVRWWSRFEIRRWVSAGATVLAVGGGLLLYEENHRQQLMDNKVSDAQLAQEVSSMVQDSEPQPTAPLEELFDE